MKKRIVHYKKETEKTIINLPGLGRAVNSDGNLTSKVTLSTIVRLASNSTSHPI